MESLCGTLRDGNSVVVHVPGDLPEGFDTVVRASLGDLLRISDFQATTAPLLDLSREYAQSPNRVRSVLDLCNDEGGFQGRLIHVRNLNADHWPMWRDFLAQYAQASRSLPLSGRTLFLAPLACCPSEEASPGHVGLSVRFWDRIVDEVDLLLFANEQLRERVEVPLLRALLANTVARVAAWDFETAAALVAEDDATISAPSECLRSIACAKGWTVDTPVDWQLGTSNREGVPHAAWAALNDPPDELDRRLWSAQLAVLLPWIEEGRYELVASHRYEVKRLMRDAGYVETDPFVLEVGDLHALFGRRGGDRHVRKSVSRLRRARNSLAHQRRMSWDRILDLVAQGQSPRPSIRSRGRRPPAR